MRDVREKSGKERLWVQRPRGEKEIGVFEDCRMYARVCLSKGSAVNVGKPMPQDKCVQTMRVLGDMVYNHILVQE